MVLPVGTIGLAVLHAGRFKGLDLFDRPETLQALWDSLLDSYAIDFLGTPLDLAAPPQSHESNITRLMLDRAVAGQWESFPSPGEGTDWRVSTPDVTAAALIWQDRAVIHLQIFPTNSGRTPRRVKPRNS